MRSSFIRFAMAFALLAVPISAMADSKAITAGKEAVRRAVRNKLGAAFRVSFIEANEKFLSLNEVSVTGSGMASEQSAWRGGRSFTFSVKAKRDGSLTRDVRLTFGEGDDIVDGPDWENSRPGEEAVSLARPSWYQRLNTNDVVFEGTSNSEVTISIFNSDNRKVADGRTKPSGGRFRTTIRVPNGLHRAVIQPALSFDWDEVRFSVRSSSSDWGLGPGTKPTPGVESVVQVDQPASGGTVNGPRVTISGTCKERDVKVEAFDSSDRRVLNSSVAVRNGRWSLTTNLADGSYRLLVQSASGKDKDQRNFRVTSPGNPGGSVEDLVEILSPKDNGMVGTSHTIAGRSKEGSVTVQVYDPSNKLVQNRRVTVNNGSWSLTVKLGSGSHRLVVESASGRDTDAIRFKVDPRIKGG